MLTFVKKDSPSVKHYVHGILDVPMKHMHNACYESKCAKCHSCFQLISKCHCHCHSLVGSKFKQCLQLQYDPYYNNTKSDGDTVLSEFDYQLAYNQLEKYVSMVMNRMTSTTVSADNTSSDESSEGDNDRVCNNSTIPIEILALAQELYHDNCCWYDSSSMVLSNNKLVSLVTQFLVLRYVTLQNSSR